MESKVEEEGIPPMRWFSRPLEWKGYVVVRIIVWSAMSMSVGSGPCSGIFSHCRCDYMADRRGAERRRGNCVVNR